MIQVFRLVLPTHTLLHCVSVTPPLQGAYGKRNRLYEGFDFDAVNATGEPFYIRDMSPTAWDVVSSTKTTSQVLLRCPYVPLVSECLPHRRRSGDSPIYTNIEFERGTPSTAKPRLPTNTSMLLWMALLRSLETLKPCRNVSLRWRRLRQRRSSLITPTPLIVHCLALVLAALKLTRRQNPREGANSSCLRASTACRAGIWGQKKQRQRRLCARSG